MNVLLVFYLVGVLATFFIGYRTLKGVEVEESLTFQEILLLVLLSLGSWLTLLGFGFGKLLRGFNDYDKKIFDNIPELDIDDIDDEELREKANRQKRFEL